MATQNGDSYTLSADEYNQLQQNQVVNKQNAQASELASTYGVPISYSSQQELDNQAQGLGLAKALYGETIGSVGADAADYTAQVKARLNQDYAGADALRQKTSQQVAKASANAGLNGVNNLAMQNQLYRSGAMEANTLNQDYKDKALAAYGRNVSARQSGQSSLLAAYKGLGVASTPTSTPNYDSGSIICTELFRQGKIGLSDYKRCSFFGSKLDHNTYLGYLIFATPVVSLMKKSDKFSNLWIGWAKSISRQEKNLFTKIMLPICYGVGYVTRIKKEKATRIA